jgi:D-inositol-3-phosphate glycosyltransferase
MLLFVGRIQPLKGADVAVRALAALPDHPGAFLAVIGGPSGPEGERELARLHRLVRELGLDGADGGDRRVVFLAPQPHEVLSSYYRAADVCLVPSRSESFGLVALEAAACGTPVVAAAVGGLRTLVEHGRTGFLVEGRDPASFAVRVAELLADPVRATVVAAEAARRARGYTWSVAARRLRQVYDHVTARSLVEC